MATIVEDFWVLGVDGYGDLPLACQTGTRESVGRAEGISVQAKWHLPLTTLTEAATRSCSIVQVDNGNTMDKHGSKLWHPLQVRFPPWTSPKSSRKFHHQDTSKPFKTNIRQPRWLEIKLGRLLQTTRLPSCDRGENYAPLRRHLHERTELEWLQGLEVLILPDSAGVAWMAEAWGYVEDMLMEFLWVIDIWIE